MKKQVLAFLCVTAALGVYPPGAHSQLFARNQHARPLTDAPAILRDKKQLKAVLQELKDYYKVDILYFDSVVESREVPASTIDVKQQLEKNLDALLRPLGLVYKKTKAGTYIITKENNTPVRNSSRKQAYTTPLENATLEAENTLVQAITGTVTDENGVGLPGVSVVLKGTTRGTTTNGEGTFELDVPGSESVLIFSFVGYTSQEITVGNQTNISVRLQTDIANLSEVVVVGFGTQKKATMTSAVSTIQSEQITARPVSNVQQSLQGLAPGLTVLDRGGAPGRSSATMRVRGITTLGDNSALVIVDGVEQTLFDMNPEDIESVTVLKDASSTAIYGSRGANGVILVTTKRGKAGKVSVGYNGYYGIQNSINTPEMMDLEPYMRLQQTAYRNVGAALPARYTDESINTWVTTTDRLKYPLPNTWFKTLLKPAPMSNQTLSVSGGNENFRARASVRLMDQKGVVMNYGSQVKELRLTTDFTASPKIRFSADANYRYNTSTTPSVNAINNFFHGALWAVPKYPDGTYGLSQQGNNPLMYLEIGGLSRQAVDRIVGNVKGEWDILDDLTLSVQVAGNYTGTYQKDFNNAYTNRDQNTGVVKTVANNTLTETRNQQREYTITDLLTYHHTWGNHDFSIMGGYQEYYYQYFGLNAFRQQFYNNDIQSINQGINDGTKNNGGYDEEGGLRSFFSRVNYTFANKYLLEVNARRDGSSRFSPAQQFAFFPSGSVGWRISEEDFFSPLKNVFHELKLRASYGQTGNQAISPYLFFPQLSASSYTFGGTVVTGYRQSTRIDPAVTWETNTQTNFGLDAALFQKKLTVTFDYYKKITDGILLNLPIPLTIGLLPGPQNAGIVENKGIELGVNYQNTATWGMTYSLGGNFSMNKNRVNSLNGTGPYITGSDIDPRYIIQEGLPINAHWGYQTSGLIQTQAEADATPYFQRSAKPGDVAFVDQNGDGIITTADMTMIGNPFPKYSFSLTSGLGYKNFQLNLFFQGTADVDVRLAGALSEAGNQEGFTSKIYTDNYWTPERTDARFPRPTKQDLRNQATTDRLIIDGSYFRLKNVQLVYNIPGTFSKKFWVQRASVYVSASNVFTISKLNEWNLDPEVESGRAVYYPQTALKTIGVNLQF